MGKFKFITFFCFSQCNKVPLYLKEMLIFNRVFRRKNPVIKMAGGRLPHGYPQGSAQESNYQEKEKMKKTGPSRKLS